MPVLEFKGKSVITTYHHTVPHHRIEFDPKASVLPKGGTPSLDDNLLIEGDNLLGLKALLPTHAGRIKSIYIDPPYNTGNEGWIYNDNLTGPQFKEWLGREVGKEGEDACRHDKWCCMMYPRLQLLRQLLRNDGSILVSIDDHELHHLRALMDEVFGEQNFIATITWKTRNTDNRVKTRLSVDHEYVLVYSMGQTPLRGRFIDRSDFENPDKDPRGPYVTDPLTGVATAEERPNLHFTIVNPRTKHEYKPDRSRGWRLERSGIDALIAESRVAWPENPKTGKPRKKRYLSETEERMPVSTFWDDIKAQSGADELDQILGERLFAFPKSLDFMRRIIDVAVGPEDVVLDVTAGSGTTGHAVLAANAEDGGRRRFLLVQLPHETLKQRADGFNICQSVTLRRLRAAIRGYTESAPVTKGRAVRGLGGSLTYCRLGAPLFDEHRLFPDACPPYADLASYVFYTEASRPADPSDFDPDTGRIGSAGQTDYYLLYDADPKIERALDMAWLKKIAKSAKGRRLVVYCEKFWFHRDDLKLFEQENRCMVRPMQVPYQLR